MNDLQALVLGMLMGTLMKQETVALDIEAKADEEGHYLDTFVVVGRNSGTRLLVSVKVE